LLCFLIYIAVEQRRTCCREEPPEAAKHVIHRRGLVSAQAFDAKKQLPIVRSYHAADLILNGQSWKGPRVTKYFLFIGAVALFGFRAITQSFRPPFELKQIWDQIAEIGSRSFPFVAAFGYALGVVMTFHTRSSLAMFGAGAMIPRVQSLAFFVEIGPLVAGLIVAGRVGAGIGAVLANMRATEQIDAIEAISLDSFNLLVVPRIIACVVGLPLLTVFMDFAGLLGGFSSEYALSHLSLRLYITRACNDLQWSNFIPPTIKTAVFGFIIGTVSSYFGYTTNEGANGVGPALQAVGIELPAIPEEDTPSDVQSSS